MKTRKISAIIALLLCVSMLAACGSYNYDLSEYAPLGQYEGVEVSAADIDEQLQSTVDSFIASNTTTSEVTDRAAKDGDVLNIDYAGNIVVVRCLPGMAQAACAALDAMQWGSVVGSLAGEDTFICITKDENRSVDLVTELKKMMKSGN